MTDNSDITKLDGGMEMEKASDPDVDPPAEPTLLEGEPDILTETSQSYAAESEAVVVASETTVIQPDVESEPPSKLEFTSESEGVVLDPSYNVFGRIILDEELYEETEVEEEEMVPSALTVITYDCIEGGNRIELVEDGYRQFGTHTVLGKQVQGEHKNKNIGEKIVTCREKKSPFLGGKDEMEEVHWVPTLESAVYAVHPTPTFNNIRVGYLMKRTNLSQHNLFLKFFDKVAHSYLENSSRLSRLVEPVEPLLRTAHYQSVSWNFLPQTLNPSEDNLKRSLASAKTYILKSYFDSTVLPGMGETLVDRYTLCNDRIEVDVINFGARVTAVRLFDRDRWVDVALGLDNVAGYLSSKSDYMGGTIGRVAGKICNATFKTPDNLGASQFYLSRNDGEDHYNGGFRALHKRLWEVKRCGDMLVLVCKCYDKEDGYPGDLTVWATFSLTGDSAFNIEYYAEADAVTPINITNAIYFNLAGHDGGPRSTYDHSVFVNSEVCCDSENVCEGKLCSVYKSPYNLTDPKHLGCVMQKTDDDGLDVSYVLYRQVPKQARETDPVPRPNMVTAAIAHHEGSGRTLVVSTNQWAMRLYTCNNLKGLKGKDTDTVYERHSGFCFQPGNLPNAVNIEHYPEMFITPNEPYRHMVRYEFSIDRDENKKSKMFLNKAPWLQDEVCLRCDTCPKGTDSNADNDLEPLYKKTYTALEKLAFQTEGDDEDSLSIHSSFTSFGSSVDLPQAGGGEMEVAEAEVGEDKGNVATTDEAECTPMMVVMEPGPLPPHLTGKWPRNPIRPIPPEEPTPIPTRRKCPAASSLLKGETLKGNPQEEINPGNTEQTESNKIKGKELRQINNLEYTPVKVGVISRVDEEKVNCAMDARTEIPLQPDDLNLSDSSIDSELNLVNNPVMGRSGDWKFRWLESPERLPWYSAKSKQEAGPEHHRRKKMGHLFKVVNFPDCFDYTGTEDELVRIIGLRNQFMKSLCESIQYYPNKNKLFLGLKEFYERDNY